MTRQLASKGTAQKLLNSFSTARMIKLARTWSNLMVDMRATNAKFRGRMINILMQATCADEPSARAALAGADGELKPDLLTLLAGVPAVRARELLDAHGGVRRRRGVQHVVRRGPSPPGTRRCGGRPLSRQT